MRLQLSLHARYQNVDGPIDAYRAADPWTTEMQRAVRDAYERADRKNPLFYRVDYCCPTCETPQEEIRFESLVFYADEDFNQLHPKGEAQLITMAGCGHQYRREVAA